MNDKELIYRQEALDHYAAPDELDVPELRKVPAWTQIWFGLVIALLAATILAAFLIRVPALGQPLAFLMWPGLASRLGEGR